MPTHLLSVAPAALRNPFGATVQGVSKVRPVVEKPSAKDYLQPPSRTPARNAGQTVYTQSPTPNPNPLTYSANGKLGSNPARSQAVSLARADTFDLAIQTAEGDVATLTISQKQKFTATQSTQRSAPEANDSFTLDSAEVLKVQMAVKGDLNAQEKASIQTLVQQVSSVAENFFAGDMQQAIHGAAGISIQGQADTLTAYAFDMQSVEVRRAAAVYEDVAARTGPLQVVLPTLGAPVPATDALPSASGRAGFIQNLLALFQGLTRSAKDMLQPPAPEPARPNQAPVVIDV